MLTKRVQTWLYDHALPFWLDKSFEPALGGFREALDFAGNDAKVPFRRVRVTCRQVYVFAHASVLGWEDGLTAAKRGAEFLVDRCWRKDGAGFVRRLDPQAQVLDDTIDLYDNAFALFAFSWLFRATDDVWARDWMTRTLDAIEVTLSHPGREGFWQDSHMQAPRLQNPHMHLTEACLAAHAAAQDPRYAAVADEMTSLMTTRFFDGRTLGETFDEDWGRRSDDDGRRVDPGHMFEWAWVLAEHMRQAEVDHTDAIAALIDFAERHGVDPKTGATYNAVRDDGAPIDQGSRTWPNAERLKAAVAARETLGRDTAQIARQTTELLLDRYLGVEQKGGWADAFDRNGAAIAPNMPTSTLYHIALAFFEALRMTSVYEPKDLQSA